VSRIVYLTNALRDLAKVANDIAEASQNVQVALTFTEKLTDYCEHIAELPGLLGRAMSCGRNIAALPLAAT
jgi:plasmid stabilization system protein ParE